MTMTSAGRGATEGPVPTVRHWVAGRVHEGAAAGFSDVTDPATGVVAARLGCDMGPLVTAAARDRVACHIDAGVAAGATLVVDG